MIELSTKEALNLIGEPKERAVDIIIQKGTRKVLIKYKIDAGFIVQLGHDNKKTTESVFTFFDADDEPELKEIADFISNRENNFEEIKLERYRAFFWFSDEFKILFEDRETGGLTWMLASVSSVARFKTINSTIDGIKAFYEDNKINIFKDKTIRTPAQRE